MAETSDTRFLNVCRRHLDIFRADPKWNPSNNTLRIVNLEAALNAAFPITDDVWAKVAPYDMKVNAQQAAFAKVAPRVRASRRYLKSSGATEAEIADANTIINTILGQRSVRKTKINPDQPAATAEKSNSVSHLSYDSRLGNLIGLRAVFANITAYNPNEDDVKLTGFDALIDECRTSLEETGTAFVPMFEAWNLRDARIYNAADSILELFRAAKEYYKSLYPVNTPQYNTITARDMALFSNSRR